MRWRARKGGPGRGSEGGRPRELDPAAVLGPGPGVAWVAIGDEVVVHRAGYPTSFVFNTTAGLLWQCLDGASPLGAIFDDIADSFGADRTDVEAGCVPVVETWLAQHLVEEVNRG